MDNSFWKGHLSQWESFLKIRKDRTEEDVLTHLQIYRQLKALTNVELGAVVNPKLLSEFINPTEITKVSGNQQFFFPFLNQAQKQAVNTSLEDNVLTLIQGPPGTGKTQVIAEICLQYYVRNPKIRILVCSQTHVAVNNLLSRVADYCLKRKRNNNPFSELTLLRIKDKEGEEAISDYLPQSIIDKYQTWINRTCRDENIRRIIHQEFSGYEGNESSGIRDKSIEKALALSTNIVGMTCNRVGAYDFSSQLEKFDVVIIDEVCKSTLPEILLPICIAEKAILVGDPKQLPPVFCTEELNIINNDIEDCHLNEYFHIDWLFSTCSNTVLLDTQYRMTKTIGKMISEVFYDGRLKTGRSQEGTNGIRWIDYVPSGSSMIEEVNSEGKHLIYNCTECDYALSALKHLDRLCSSNTVVAVISPYKGQVELINRKLDSMGIAFNNLKIKVNTVDSFQGKECDFVIFCITRTEGPGKFWTDRRRLNVALSRAKNGIIIIGSKMYAVKNSLLAEIASYC